ncbi:MAG: hypothetical protein IPH44_09790 [Myxococcales bacterium]|nr:hypothetical protein [Myxococcales bacterium]MBK7198838.1 hypothetical protein [Myxococcales bacterium]
MMALAAVVLFGGCPRGGAQAPRGDGAAAWLASGEAPLGGVAIAGDAAVASRGRSLVRTDAGAPTWTQPLPADGGAVAIAGDVVAVAVSGSGAVDGLPLGLRGEPGAAVIGVAAADGKRRWIVGIGATEWASVRALAAGADGLLVAGGFAGTLRVGDRVVTSAGRSDGFWARLGPDGVVRGLWRMGGPGADDVAGIAALPDGQLAIAGTYGDRAELGDLTIPALYDDVHGDGFVATVAADSAVRWVRTFGGPSADACAGVAATTDGVVVAGTVRGAVDVAGRRLDAAGAADGLVAYFDRAGAVRATVLVGGPDFDGLTAVVARGDTAVVAGWFSGTVGGATAAGGDDAMLATVTPAGVAAITPIRSDGLTTVRGLAGDEGGWAAAIESTVAVEVGGRAMAAGATIAATRW